MKQAYGSEPVLFTSSPITPEPKPSSHPAKKHQKYKMLVVCCVAGVFLALIAGTLIFRHRPPAGLSSSLAATVTFPLYQPTWLPEGYYIDRQSASTTSQVATFTINSSAGKALIVTEQPRPSDDQMATFYDGQLSNKKSFETTVGKAATGQFEGTPLAGVTTEKTWVLVRAVGTTTQEQFERIIRSLKIVQ